MPIQFRFLTLTLILVMSFLILMAITVMSAIPVVMAWLLTQIIELSYHEAILITGSITVLMVYATPQNLKAGWIETTLFLLLMVPSLSLTFLVLASLMTRVFGFDYADTLRFATAMGLAASYSFVLSLGSKDDKKLEELEEDDHDYDYDYDYDYDEDEDDEEDEHDKEEYTWIPKKGSASGANSIITLEDIENLNLPPNAPCYCGSGKKYGRCHGRRF